MTSGEVIMSRVGMLGGAEVLLVFFTFVSVVLLAILRNLTLILLVDIGISGEGSLGLEIKGIFVYLSLYFLESLDAKVESTYSDGFRVITII